MALKPDAAEIRAFLDELRRAPWLGKRRSAWPNFIYRYSDVRDVAKILRSGRLLSRTKCAALGVVFQDAANPEIINQSPQAHGYARLYFRPHTPTQYRMEGIRPLAQRWRGAHCPVPVFLLFDSNDLLTRTGTVFTRGNFARYGCEYGSDAAFLRTLDFQDIYHDEALPSDLFRKDEIKNARHSEVLVADELDLDQLREVVCRTGAEMETLLSLLGDRANDWRDRVRLERIGELLFYRDFAYLIQVLLIDRKLVIKGRAVVGPYRVQVHIWAPPDAGAPLVHDETYDGLPSQLTFALPKRHESVRVRVMIEGDSLAYEGVVTQQSVF